MKKAITIVLALALVATGATVAGAAAKKKKKPKPVVTTLYMHGEQPLGEIDAAEWIANGTSTADVLQMDPTAPTGSQPKSQQWGYAAFNTNCSGLPLFPTWVGNLQGTIVGDAKLTIHSISAPGSITARIWTDTPVFSCNDAYIPPAAEVQVTPPPGSGSFEVVFEGLNLKAQANVMIELLGTTTQGRVLYDSTSADTNLEFSCVPARGTTCTPE